MELQGEMENEAYALNYNFCEIEVLGRVDLLSAVEWWLE